MRTKANELRNNSNSKVKYIMLTLMITHSVSRWRVDALLFLFKHTQQHANLQYKSKLNECDFIYLVKKF